MASGGVVFRLWISPRIWSQNWNGLKCSVRDLCRTDLCKNPRKSAPLPCPFKFTKAVALSTIQYMYSLSHGRMNYKDTKPYMSAFLSVDLLIDFAAFCLTDFIDWRYIHSWFVFRPSLWTVAPMDEGTILVYCCPSTVPSLWPPPSPFPMYSIYRQCVTVGGGGMGGVEMHCGPYSPYSAGVLLSVSDQIQNLQNCFTTPNKNDQ
jgi:hypothetical protein